MTSVHWTLSEGLPSTTTWRTLQCAYTRESQSRWTIYPHTRGQTRPGIGRERRRRMWRDHWWPAVFGTRRVKGYQCKVWSCERMSHCRYNLKQTWPAQMPGQKWPSIRWCASPSMPSMHSGFHWEHLGQIQGCHWWCLSRRISHWMHARVENTWE